VGDPLLTPAIPECVRDEFLMMKQYSDLRLVYFTLLYVFRPVFRSYQPQAEELKELQLPKAKPVEGLYSVKQ